MESEKATTSQGPITVDVVDKKGNPVGSVDLDPTVFDAPVKVHLLHEVVVYQQAKHRAGTGSAKTRGEVSGSNRKPYRQKGTGRARQGERTSPIHKGGGVIFGPKPRDFSFKVSKKIKKAALKSALSEKRRDGKLTVVDDIPLDEIKTRLLVEWLEDMELGANVLIVLQDGNDKVMRSARNLPKVKALRADGINVRDVLLYDRLVLTKDAAARIQEALS